MPPEPAEAADVPGWLPFVGELLAVAGLGVSIYLTLTHYDASAVPLACSDRGVINCAKVTTSPEAMVFGVIPVAVLGLPFFVAMLVLQSPLAWRSPAPLVRWGRLAAVVVGIGFVGYLVYTELFTLHAVCLWCTAVHVLTFLLFALTVMGTALVYPAHEPGGQPPSS